MKWHFRYLPKRLISKMSLHFDRQFEELFDRDCCGSGFDVNCFDVRIDLVVDVSHWLTDDG